MWVFYAVLTVLFWGTSDTIFKKSSQGEPDSVYQLLAYNGIVLGICSIIYGIVVSATSDYRFTFDGLVRYIPVAAIYITSMFFYYRALPLIKLSIASPIANSSCLLVTLLCVFVLNQQIAPLQWAAVIMIVAGLMTLSFNKGEGELSPEQAAGRRWPVYVLGICCALMYTVLDGAGSFLDDYTLDGMLSPEQVNVSYGLIYMAVGLVCLVIVKRKTPEYRFVTDKYKMIGSLLETGGQFTYIYAFASGDAALASPFIACFSVLSVILSRVFLKEKLKLYQYAVVAVMFVGMAILAIE